MHLVRVSTGSVRSVALAERATRQWIFVACILISVAILDGTGCGDGREQEMKDLGTAGPVRIGIVQPEYPGWDPDTNTKKATSLISAFQRGSVDIICLPELYPGKPGDLASCAKRIGCYLVYGFAERQGGASGSFVNEAVILDPEGREVLRQRKVLLGDSEREFGYIPGKDYAVVHAPWGTFGVAICNDVALSSRSVEVLVSKGAGLVLVPSMAVLAMHDYWHLQLLSRSLDYGVPIAFVNIAGSYEVNGLKYGGGRSKIVVPLPPSEACESLADFLRLEDSSPSEHVVAEFGAVETTGVVTVELGRYRNYRENMSRIRAGQY